jgi:hypothetical protein
LKNLSSKRDWKLVIYPNIDKTKYTEIQWTNLARKAQRYRNW